MDNDQDIVALAKHLYQQAQELKHAKRVEAAIRCLRSSLYYDPSLRPAYSDLAALFLSLNMAGQAMHTIDIARNRFDLNGKETGLHDLARSAHQAIHRTAAMQETVLGFSVDTFLGAGWEGAVYRAIDSHKTKWIVKAFHPGEIKLINYEGMGGVLRNPLPSCQQDLESLETEAARESKIDTIYPIKLIRIEGKIVGIKYPYEKLWEINQEIRRHPSIKLLSLVAFFKVQAFLIKTCRILLNDPVNGFMITRDGRIRYIDYGRSIIPIDDFRCREDCLDALCFFRFLFHIIEPSREIKKIIQSVRYSAHTNKACLSVLLKESKRQPGLTPVLSDVSNDHLDVFHDSDFYETLAVKFRHKISFYETAYFHYASIVETFAHLFASSIKAHTKNVLS
jgi:hypothetical protein